MVDKTMSVNMEFENHVYIRKIFKVVETSFNCLMAVVWWYTALQGPIYVQLTPSNSKLALI